jgi:hypothetical protein
MQVVVAIRTDIELQITSPAKQFIIPLFESQQSPRCVVFSENIFCQSLVKEQSDPLVKAMSMPARKPVSLAMRKEL